MLVRILTGVCCAVLWVPAAASPVRADSNTGVVHGYVYADNSTRPVCGMRVTAEANNQVTQTTYSDTQGFFVFISRFPGIVHVYADDPNPRAERLVDVHPALNTEPVLYVSARSKRAALARCERMLRAERGRSP